MTPPDEINLARAIELLDGATKSEEPLGYCPEDRPPPIYLKQGRFGPYVQLGHKDDEEETKNASVKGYELGDVTLELALKLLQLPRTVGEHPELKEPIIATNGRYGPYIKCGSDSRSLPNGLSPVDVTFEQAMELCRSPSKVPRSSRSQERTNQGLCRIACNQQPRSVA